MNVADPVVSDRFVPDRLVAALTAALPDAVELHAPLGVHTTYRVGGPAAVLVSVEDTAALADLGAVLAAEDPAGRVPLLVLGRGSNLLVADAGFAGIVVRLGSGFETITVDPADAAGTCTVHAGGAASLPVVARRTVAAGCSGFAWAVGVPGSVGGAVRMNAGGHGADMAASLVSATIVDLRTGATSERPAEALALGYRRAAVRPDEVVAAATLRLAVGDRAAGEAELAAIVSWRREHQPGGQNAGSVFTNPPGDSAGRLIDAAGCKGLRIGTAEVSSKHANFFQADPGGSADDVLSLMREVQRRVEARFGVRLEPETRLAGFGEPDGHDTTGVR